MTEFLAIPDCLYISPFILIVSEFLEVQSVSYILYSSGTAGLFLT